MHPMSVRAMLIGCWIGAAAVLAGAATSDDGDRPSIEAPSPERQTPQEAQILVMIRMAPVHFRPDVDYSDGYAGRAAHAARRRAAEGIARTHGLQLLSHWPMPAIGVECYAMQLRPGVAMGAALDALANDPRAAWAQPVQFFKGLAYNDPLYGLQPTASAWQLQRLHAVATGRGVLIAQIDSGVDAEHPDLRGQVQLVHNAVAHSRAAPEPHGTAVAGIIAARADNGIGTVGVAPDARLLALRGCWEHAPGGALCDSFSLAKALQVALDRHAQVVNLSLSGPPDRVLRELLNAALERGVTVVAAADAEAADGGFPASHPGALSVTGTDTAPPVRASLAAPGRDVPAPLPGARWGMVSGASFAAAEVSGLVGLLLELVPGARPVQIEALLRRATTSRTGEGILAPSTIDACRSVALAAGRCACDCSAAASDAVHARR